jgi:hypothetical protein
MTLPLIAVARLRTTAVVHRAYPEVEKLSDSWKHARGKLANLSKTLDRDDPRLADLRRDIRAGRLATST